MTHTAGVPTQAQPATVALRQQDASCKSINAVKIVTCMQQYSIVPTRVLSFWVAAAAAAAIVAVWPQLVRHGPRQLCPRQPKLLRLRLRPIGVMRAGVGYLEGARGRRGTVTLAMRWFCKASRPRVGVGVGVSAGEPVLHCGQKPGTHNRTETQRRP